MHRRPSELKQIPPISYLNADAPQTCALVDEDHSSSFPDKLSRCVSLWILRPSYPLPPHQRLPLPINTPLAPYAKPHLSTKRLLMEAGEVGINRG